jgi:lipopolysaccharide export system permease protein
MKIIDRYIQAQLAKGFLIVLIVLVSMFSFLDFVEELDDTTLGNYHVLDAAVFVIRTVP